MSSSSMFAWLAKVAMVAIALHNWIKEGGGNRATLNGCRLNISPDNIQSSNRVTVGLPANTEIVKGKIETQRTNTTDK